MSSVQGAKMCPKCGGVMFYEFNCNTSEEDRLCTRCGFTQKWFLVRDEQGNLVTNKDGKFIMDYTEKLGYGIAGIYEGDREAIYFFDKPMTEKDCEKYVEACRKAGTENNSSFVVLFNPETGTFTPLFGEVPPEYTDEDNI